MNNTIFDRLEMASFANSIQYNIPLKNFTTMRVGGPADCFLEAENEKQVAQAIAFAQKEEIPFLLIGNGSNMVISDHGFHGIVIHLGKEMAEVKCEGIRITAQAGALLPVVSRLAAENGLSGLEFAAGIPGSVGGAAVMNAGAYGGEMKQVVESVRVIADGEIKTLSIDEMNYGYRHSVLMEKPWTVLSVTFHLDKGNKDEILAVMADLNARRRKKQPIQYPSSGSFFKRPEGHFAGALIQNAGLKGFSVGGAQVSELHAGFVINTGDATANDIYRLMHHVQNAVKSQFDVCLEPEVRMIGWFDA